MTQNVTQIKMGLRRRLMMEQRQTFRPPLLVEHSPQKSVSGTQKDG